MHLKFNLRKASAIGSALTLSITLILAGCGGGGSGISAPTPTSVGFQGIVTTLAGASGVQGSLDGTGTLAQFSQPYGITVDASGNVYVADTNNNTIRKITAAGVVTTLAGTAGVCASAVSTQTPANCTVDATGAAARFWTPSGITVDANGNLYVADRVNRTIRKVTATGVVTTLAGRAGVMGSLDGTGLAASFAFPAGITLDALGNLYVTDSLNHNIRKITQAGVVTTLAGTAGVWGSLDGTGVAAQFNNPNGITVDAAGNLYVADTGNNTIRKITQAGVVTTLAGTAGVMGSLDGTGLAAQFKRPAGLTMDAAGNLYVADMMNNTIRKITAAGVVTTLAGTAGACVLGLGGRPTVPANCSADATGTAARFNYPQGITVDAAGNLYVADTYNNTIRKIQ